MKWTIPLILMISLSGCSTPPKPKQVVKVEHAELTFPYLKPLKLTPIRGKFRVGDTPQKSFFIMKYSEYTEYLVNNRLIANRLRELRRRLNAYRHYYSKKGIK